MSTPLRPLLVVLLAVPAFAQTHTPGKMPPPSTSTMSKEGGDKDGKGGKDKMTTPTASTMSKEGGDKDGKGGKDKMTSPATSTMVKEGGDKGGKGPKVDAMKGAPAMHNTGMQSTGMQNAQKAGMKP